MSRESSGRDTAIFSTSCGGIFPNAPYKVAKQEAQCAVRHSRLLFLKMTLILHRIEGTSQEKGRENDDALTMYLRPLHKKLVALQLLQKRLDGEGVTTEECVGDKNKSHGSPTSERRIGEVVVLLKRIREGKEKNAGI